MTPDPVHIRDKEGWPQCQRAFEEAAPGGSISLRHYREQPQHWKDLPMCPACVERADQIREGER